MASDHTDFPWALLIVLGDFPAEPDAGDAAEAAHKEAAEELQSDQHTQRPERVAEDRGAGEDAELIHEWEGAENGRESEGPYSKLAFQKASAKA